MLTTSNLHKVGQPFPRVPRARRGRCVGLLVAPRERVVVPQGRHTHSCQTRSRPRCRSSCLYCCWYGHCSSCTSRGVRALVDGSSVAPIVFDSGPTLCCHDREWPSIPWRTRVVDRRGMMSTPNVGDVVTNPTVRFRRQSKGSLVTICVCGWQLGGRNSWDLLRVL